MALGASLGACTSDDGEVQRAAPPTEATTTTAVVVGEDLAEALGCDPELGRDESAWYFGLIPDRLGDCERDGRFVARLVWYDEPTLLAEAASEYERFATQAFGSPCPDGTTIDPRTWVVVGPDWLAVTISEDRAAEVAELTGGRLTGASPTPGPPPSFLLPFGEQC